MHLLKFTIRFALVLNVVFNQGCTTFSLLEAALKTLFQCTAASNGNNNSLG